MSTDDINEIANLEASSDLLEGLNTQDASEPDVFSAIGDILFDNWDIITEE